MPYSFAIDLPERFSFRHTVSSHGWYDLPPFDLDEEAGRLGYVFQASGSEPAISVTINSGGGKLAIKTSSRPKDVGRIERGLRHILRLDEPLEDFYSALEKDARLAWIAEVNAGRLLRSPTVWEDLVKTICTTNCSWGLTKKMVSNLVETLGEEAPDGQKAFPTAASMASMDLDFYRTEIRAGYRSSYFVELAESVATGNLDPESWMNSELPSDELKKELKRVKGVGDYAAENLLKLLGRYDGLALDSWVRSQFYKKHNRERVCDDKKIHKFYQKFGPWKGLAVWCDMTENWFA